MIKKQIRFSKHISSDKLLPHENHSSLQRNTEESERRAMNLELQRLMMSDKWIKMAVEPDSAPPSTQC